MERQNDLDWVRILAVLLLIPFHTARIFDTFEPFYVKNKDLSAVVGSSRRAEACRDESSAYL
jgi:hypothetical protein